MATKDQVGKLKKHFDIRLVSKSGRGKLFVLRPKKRNERAATTDSVLSPFRRDQHYSVHDLMYDAEHGTKTFALESDCPSICESITSASTPAF